jgi:hypothetical protein
MVSMEKVFNFIPRTGFASVGTIRSFETGAVAFGRVPDTFLCAFVGMFDLTFLD